MTRPTDAQVAEVWRDATLVGRITRSPHGSDFEYAEAFFVEHAAQPGGVAVHLPYRRRVTETRGTNLHTYFAGLLPEGLRLRALVQRTKTSEDDLFSLLVAAGTDSVGDLAVLLPGERPTPPGDPGPRWRPETVLFHELFEQSLSRTAAARDEPVVPGVQEKVSASTISFPLRAAGPRAYLLKLNPRDKPQLVQNEAFFMQMARACGLDVAPTLLVHDREANPGLLVQRFDRRWVPDERRFLRVHQEDACQFLDRYPADKYRIPCSDIARGIRETCAAPVPELARFLRLVAFSYLIGNGDLHAKNVSILSDAAVGGFRLSPAYDLLSTLPYGDRRMALSLDGRDDNLKRAHFVEFGARFGVNARALTRMLDRLCARAEPWLQRLGEIGLDARRTRALHELMRKRLEELGSGDGQ